MRVSAPTTTATSATVESLPRPAARIYIDPVTGATRAPTAEEAARAAAEASAQVNASSQVKASGTPSREAATHVTETRLPNGMTEVDLGNAGMVKEVVCVQKDGSLGPCGAAAANAVKPEHQAKHK